MLFRYFTLQIACAVALASCSDRKVDETTSSAPESAFIHIVELLDADSAPETALMWRDEAPTTCTFEYAPYSPNRDTTTAIRRDGERLELADGPSRRAVLERNPTGSRLIDGNGEQIARVVTQPGPPRRISVLDPQGIALFRLRADGPGRATLLDKASVPRFTVSPESERLVTKTRDESIVHYVQGTDDAVLAGLLSAPQLDLAYRLLLACDHILGSTDES